MKLELDNFLAFRDFSLNLSYPKKIVNSYIPCEYLSCSPNFKYKKLLIIMGSNAAGKTSLGQMFNHIFSLIMRKQTEMLIKSVCDRRRTASVLIDFVPSEKPLKLCRFEVRVDCSEIGSEPEVTARYRSTCIRSSDNYKSACKRIDGKECEYEDYLDVVREMPAIGYFFSYPIDVLPNIVLKDRSGKYRAILEKVLRVLDAGIERVEIVSNAENSYNIHMRNGQNVLIQEGHVVDTSLLSSGTKAGIGIADILTAMKEHKCGFYYCDERFSYIQSEIEKAALSLMLELLGDGEQLIFTTHNMDMLNLPLPKHTYVFLKKTVTETGSEISNISASDFLKRNTDSLRCAVKNDIFSVLPDTGQIYEIAND